MRAVRGVFVLALAVSATVSLDVDPAQAATLIQPGARIFASGGLSACTLGFVYDGTGEHDGEAFIGTAAHCVTHVGQDVSLLDSSGDVFGDVAVLGDLTTTATDWALIQVRPTALGQVSPAMRNHPGYPTGVTSPDQTAVGDPVQLNDGNQPKAPVPLHHDDANIYRVGGTLEAPPSVVPSDSGGPLVHIPTGRALGVVSSGLNCLLPPTICEEYEGPTVQGVLAKAAAMGFTVTLRTV